jgi:DNA modification methylase
MPQFPAKRRPVHLDAGEPPARQRLTNGPELRIEFVAIDHLRPNPRAARRHPKKQIASLVANISRFGFNDPLGVGPDNLVLVGNARLQAAKDLGLTELPVVRLDHLTPEEQRLYALAHNRLGELAEWDIAILSEELKELEALDLDIPLEITGFDGAFLDQLIDGSAVQKLDPKADRIPELTGAAVTRIGDVWICGKHRLICGDALDPGVFQRLMGSDRARMVFTDPPYNVRIDGNVGGKGKLARREFAMASGEMSAEAFTAFLTTAHRNCAEVSQPGAIHFSCMDWRHVSEMSAMGASVYGGAKNLIVWAKENAGMGTFYRSQHELVFAFKVGEAPHINNFGLGETGRYRTNVWSYPGVNSFGRGRDEALGWHPTVKPVALVADAIRDVSRRGEIVLDPFGGSGTTLIAAQKTGRRARLIELDPHYCDVICRRWRAFSGEQAVLEATAEAFEQVADARGEDGDGEEGGGEEGGGDE